MSAPRRLRPGLLGLGVGAAVAAASAAGWLDRLEGITWDARAARLAVPAPDDLKIRLVLLDRASLDWQVDNGVEWPWPREVYEELIDFCGRAAVRALVFDWRFDQPDLEFPDSDEKLAAAMAAAREARLPLVLPVDTSGGGFRQWPGIPRSPFAVGHLERWIAERDDDPFTVEEADFPIPQLARKAAALGHVQARVDGDGVLRRIAPLRTFDDEHLPTLALAAYGADWGSEDRSAPTAAESWPMPPMRIAGSVLTLDGRPIPIDRRGDAVLRFRRPIGGYLYPWDGVDNVISAELRMERGEPPRVDLADYRDAWVFFGVDAPGIYDHHVVATPVSSRTTGVEVHATVLDNYLTAGFLRPAPAWLGALFTLAVAAAAALVGSGLPAAAGRRGPLAAALGVCLTPWIAGWAAYPLGVWWPIAGPALAAVLGLVGGLVLRPGPSPRPVRPAPAPADLPEPAFDVFLSHNSVNKPRVRELAAALDERGLRVWLDERELVPGRPWQDALGEVIRTVKSAAVLVGEDGLGPWEAAEVRGLLSEFVDRRAPVIPVLLPGARSRPELPFFLRQFTWVDLRDGLRREGLDRLEWGITGIKPAGL